MLRLESVGQSASTPHAKVLIHDISLTGLLIESSSPLPFRGHFEVELPIAGYIEAEVVWTSGAFFGCRFRTPITQAALSAAQLQAEPHVAQDSASADPLSGAVIELRELSTRVQQLRSTIDREIDKLSRERLERTQQIRKTAAYEEQAEDTSEVEDDRLSFPNRIRIILALTLGSWALILWALWAIL